MNRLNAVAMTMLSVFIVLAAVSAAFAARAVSDSNERVEHALMLREMARAAHGRVQAAERGQRGFLLTENRDYLAPFLEARALIDIDIERLRALVEDDAAQQERLGRLESAVAEKFEEMGRPVAIAEEGDFAVARRLFASDAGLGLMREIDAVVGEMVAWSTQELNRRQAQFSSRIRLLTGLIVTALFATVVLAGLTVFASRRVALHAGRRSAELDELNRGLEARVRERTRDLDTARLAAEREQARCEMLLQDINHRIGNNLAMVSALLGMQAANVEDKNGRAALEAARERVYLIGNAQRRLRLKEDLQSTDAGEVLSAVAADLVGALPASTRPEMDEDYAPVTVDSRDAVTLCVIMSELITNAIKHAFTDVAEPRIWVRLAVSAKGELYLEVADNGRGRGGDGGEGLGSTIVRRLSRHYGGQVFQAPRDGGGHAVTVTLPSLAQTGQQASC